MNRDADIVFLLSESMATRLKARKVAAVALIAALKSHRPLDDEADLIAAEVERAGGREAGFEVRSLCRALGYCVPADRSNRPPSMTY